MNRNLKCAVALGLFDGLHLGHAEVLKSALNSGARRRVVFTFGETTPLPKFYGFARDSILPEKQKIDLLYDMGFDEVVSVDFAEIAGFTGEEFVRRVILRQLSADFLAVGYNFRFGSDGRTAAYLKQLGGKSDLFVRIVPAVTALGHPISSTAIRSCIKKGDIERVNKMLGFELFYVLPVTEGLKLARTMGVPTINQHLPLGIAVPRYGVYGGFTEIHGRVYRSVTNIGIKPTVERADRDVLIETHVLGFDGDIYGESVKVALSAFMRPEEKFASLAQLKARIHADVKMWAAGEV
ncbi:riboflavin biosynthesis protein [Clostridia bacterium]|nr:riboflavin biosynthesis protein [Clostridia bacterium]